MNKELWNLDGKIAVVTGGSRGLGREMVLAFARAGATVVIASRKIEACEAVAAEVRATGGEAFAISVNASRWDAVEALSEAVYDRLGRIDILVNNAGMSPAAPSHEVTEALFDKILALNFKGPFRLSSLVAQRMAQADGGVIINVSSAAARRPSPQVVPYAAAKAALDAMTQSLAHEYAPKVRVNGISAGPFLTDIAMGWRDEDRVAQDNALGRPGQPSEIVTSALFLATSASSFVTGTVIRCDGGMH
ncbi:MAG: glucose 1-dehydrogenase [Novosphingobium sp.]